MLDGRWFDAHLSRLAREWLLVIIIVGAVAVTFAGHPVVQNPAYNHFADERAFLGIPNFLDVVSNLALLFVGLNGLAFLARRLSREIQPTFSRRSEMMPYFCFFAGVVLTAFGSAYYHWAPSDNRLVWDRLPMTIVFMSLLAITIGERLDLRAGLISLPFLLSIGVASVVYWHLSELKGSGDLRVYLDVQYLATLAIPLIALLFPSRYTRARTIYAVFLIYLVSKSFELLDQQIYSLTQVVSGHTAKHLFAAAGTYLILLMLRSRNVLSDSG